MVDLDDTLSECGQYGIDIRELKISQINEHFRMGRLTSLELTQCYLDRISEMDVHFRSVIEVNPDAIALAETADMERSEGSVTLSNLSMAFNVQTIFFRLNDSPIHGIPILIKDNIGTADQMQTTAGAIALEDLKPIRDAEVVARLRKAGAIILGKASLSEWAKYVMQFGRNKNLSAHAVLRTKFQRQHSEWMEWT